MRTPQRMRPPSPPALDHQAHRAVGSASRAHLIQAMLAEGPLEADQLAGRVGLHLNTVRAHLAVLRQANWSAPGSFRIPALVVPGWRSRQPRWFPTMGAGVVIGCWLAY